jgi:hypothetical protein
VLCGVAVRRGISHGVLSVTKRCLRIAESLIFSPACKMGSVQLEL